MVAALSDNGLLPRSSALLFFFFFFFVFGFGSGWESPLGPTCLVKRPALAGPIIFPFCERWKHPALQGLSGFRDFLVCVFLASGMHTGDFAFTFRFATFT